MREWSSYWTQLAHARHLVGDHERELDAARALRARFPERRVGVVLEARALAALGRDADVAALVDGQRGVSPTTYWSQGAAMVVAGQELRAHGHLADGDRWLARGTRWLQGQLALQSGDRGHRFWLAGAHYTAGRWAEAQRLYAALSAEQPERLDVRALAALSAARLGATDAEQRLGAAAPHERGTYTAYRARLAAIRSDHAHAATLLAEAVRAGVDALPWLHATARRDLEPLLAARVPLPASLRAP
jgi:hypothetical protein